MLNEVLLTNQFFEYFNLEQVLAIGLCIVGLIAAIITLVAEDEYDDDH